QAEPEAAIEAGTDVAHLVQFAAARRFAPALVEACTRAALDVVRGGSHAGTYRLVNALDLRRVERAARIADQHRPGHLERRHRLITALDHGARTSGDDFPAAQQLADVRVVLVLLKGFEGLEPRILVIQPHHEAHVDAIVVEVIKKASAIGAAVERPADGVLNEAGLYAPRGQLPQLLESQAVGLRGLAGIELEAPDELLGGAAAAALAEHGDFRVNLRSQRKIRAGLAVLLHAHVADAHALHGAGVVEQRLACGNPANTSTPSLSASAPRIGISCPREMMKLP